MTAGDNSKRERARLIERGRRNLAEIEQIFRDLAHWNAAHPDETPIDIDPDGLLARIAEGYRRMLAADPGHGPIARVLDAATRAEIEAEQNPH